MRLATPMPTNSRRCASRNSRHRRQGESSDDTSAAFEGHCALTAWTAVETPSGGEAELGARARSFKQRSHLRPYIADKLRDETGAEREGT